MYTQNVHALKATLGNPLVSVSQQRLLNRQSGLWGIADISSPAESLLYLGNGIITCGASYLIPKFVSNMLGA